MYTCMYTCAYGGCECMYEFRQYIQPTLLAVTVTMYVCMSCMYVTLSEMAHFVFKCNKEDYLSFSVCMYVCMYEKT